MKKNILLCSFLLIACISFAQIKPKQKDKPPTQKEMTEMMNEMQSMTEGMNAEDKKMLDSMGFKMPDLKGVQKTVAGLNDAQITKANNDNNRIVPLKDAARISAALSLTISDAAMPAYIEKLHGLVTQKMKPEQAVRAESIYMALSQNIGSSTAIGQTAVGVLMDGKPMLAIYLMGKACKKLPDADNLNNYAAVLTNFGAEQLAIPILNNLSKKYPANSTIYNNIGQAWFGLGDIEKANKYIDSAIRLYAYHPQANFTKCLIEESKGNKLGAIEAAKRSIKKGYSLVKANKLDKLGYQLKSDDVDWNAPMPKDELGLNNFKWPVYPKNVDESKEAEGAWEIFRQECTEKLNELNAQQEMLEEQMQAAQQNREKQLLQASQTGTGVSLFPEMMYKALIKLGPAVKGFEAANNYVFADKFQAVLDAQKTIAAFEKEEAEDMRIFNKKFAGQFGEGKSNPFDSACIEENKIRNRFLKKANGFMEDVEKKYLHQVSQQTDNLLYYRKYTQWPDQYAYTTVVAKISWLTIISRQIVSFRNRSTYCQHPPKEKDPQSDSLQNFDDVACKYISTTNLGCFTITSQCSRLIGDFDCGGITIHAKQNDETNRFSGSVFVGAGKSVSVGKGPISAEAEVTAAVGVEISENGSTDLVGKVGGNINVAGQTVVGAEGRAGVNSGPSVSGKGMLQGIGQ